MWHLAELKLEAISVFIFCKLALDNTSRLADSLPRKLLDDWLRTRDAFLAANPPPRDNLTKACYHDPWETGSVIKS